MTFADALALGRVSNLPTVWTNVLVGVVLSGAGLSHPALPPLLVALTLFYVGGMYINDFFDAGIDALERPERPIPSGRTARRTVGIIGFTMLGLGVTAMGYIASSQAHSLWPAIVGVALVAAIVLYNAHHKANPLSPFIMGLCRVLVYLCAAVSIAVPPPDSLLAAMAALLCYLIGLTYVAKQENLGRVANMWPLGFLAAPLVYGAYLALSESLTWALLGLLLAWIVYALRFVVRRGPGDIPRAVVSLIAGICLLDAMLVASAGAISVMLLCVAGFVLTLLFQRYVPGT
jgi:4-hydroxybenzoate polyprenyltransferase